MASSSDDEEANNSKRYDNLCRDLNMDEETSNEAWSSYERISTNYTLEVSFINSSLCALVSRILIFVYYSYASSVVRLFALLISCFYFKELLKCKVSFQGDSLHWLACALYVACRRSVVPTVDSSAIVEGNCVSLTRLLRAAKLR